jgi:hypothetical protein
MSIKNAKTREIEEVTKCMIKVVPGPSRIGVLLRVKTRYNIQRGCDETRVIEKLIKKTWR